MKTLSFKAGFEGNSSFSAECNSYVPLPRAWQLSSIVSDRKHLGFVSCMVSVVTIQL
jgi:hypothetical protein